MKKYKLYIGGEFVESSSGHYIGVENPATGKIFAEVSDGNSEDVNNAVMAAREALNKWKNIGQRERAVYLEGFADYIEEYKEEIGRTITAEIGTAVKYVVESHVMSSIEQARFFAELLKKYSYEEIHENYILRKEPIGIVACLTPWNYPFYQETAKIFPAIAAGNCVVLKPSRIAPVSVQYLADAAEKIGLPAGVLNIITGKGENIGNALSAHQNIDMVSFTGSTEQGKKVGVKGISSNVKKVALELGGKSAAVLLKSADFKSASSNVMMQCFLNTGQTCVAPTRLIAPREIKKELEDYMIEFASGFVVGDPMDKNTDIGPLVSRQAFDKVNSYIEKGVEEGAKLIFGGKAESGDQGYYVLPTIFTETNNDMTIGREEIFGPVLSVMYYDTEKEALEMVNDSIYGLGGAVFGERNAALKFAEEIEAGVISINGAELPTEAPFGGYKQSGLGRENGEVCFEEFLEIKSIAISKN